MPHAPAPLPSSTRVVTGRGGLTELHIHNRHARAVVALQGAQLLSFQPHGEPDWLYLSPNAVFAPGRPVRGGVPLCWPWFGPDPQGLGRPAHGLARQSPWVLRHALDESDGCTLLELELSDDAATRALWPHRFRLRLEIRVGATLALALTTRNLGDTHLTLTQALHNYFAIDHIEGARVHGLDGLGFIDQVPGANPQGAPAPGPLAFAGRLDRIYPNAPTRLQLEGAAGGGRLTLDSEGSRSAVVWNPGAELAAGMADLGPDEHSRFVCVETANAGDDVVTLAPGAEHRLALAIARTTEPSHRSPP
ncbi:MAG: D-hexose-6-phosphate mutarotase [Hydrogenophaga sp.]|uniref:D-hexose-6-phosphate mutarotase n=1 Tax=Hydrogenophaga sp. TaxID=1904254 RepID=UPI00257BF7B1|nr:D-hexose-6-phosphate mutarotase [Hydrogenophaga sp.]MBL0943223.1 D-hexose-6-phosphate mutarotase [Hydrogenophaga sp.]